MVKIMTDSTTPKATKVRHIISFIACIFIGLTLIMAGSGKLFGYGEVPGQTMEFIGDVLPDFLLNKFTINLLYNIIIPYVVPYLELAIGIFLLIGFLPRIMAIVFIPLTLVFMANNAWAIMKGMDKYPSCTCFGIWEEVLGGLTPLQSLYYDITLFILAVVIIVLHPAGLLASRNWMRTWKGEKVIKGLNGGL
jgi:uncharacterized membrane protein YphA (DoxX/SURF4 family)